MSEAKKTVEITTAKPITGNKIFYFIQSVHADLGSAATLPAYRTDGSTTLGGEYLDEQTQQGRLVEKSTDEHSIDVTQYFAPKDPSIKTIEDASRSGDSVKIWEVIVDESVKTQEGDKDVYPAKFGYAKIADFERSNAMGEFVEVSWTGNVVGALQDGKFPLSEEEINLLNSVYDYQNPGETTGDYDDIKKAAPSSS
ncbi:TPA: phage major tail protein, TP901-1 family [Streptococcus suis]|nr:phage major tail protein, TP901-1 family [Streptococcus suis]HEM4147327.1 phage major tail protein, TP901-1 family [Streptococcus suis]HEM4402334.1 phage major tail protein, TP901-1 family [Streptococcus suis]HEM6128304.1 phage major tail protein, TP901-1 family [Streptococcus suis]HEM6130575.1 phage major tail protein, TP901-1 family [Streptococcus suis]